MKINSCYKIAFKNKSRYLLLFGGAGSGKSYFIAQKIITRIMTETPHRILLIRKVHKTIKKSQFQLIKDIIYGEGLESFFKFNNSDYSIIHSNGNEIISCGVDDVEKLKSIQGITSIWIEEATELTQADFQQINLRLRGETKHYKQIILSFNPISNLHWLNSIELENCFTLRTTYKDNKFIDEDYKRELEALKEQDLNFYNIYTLGEWGTLLHLVYRPFAIIPEMPETFDEVIYGLDFGYNNPTALMKIGVRDENYFIQELIYETKLTNTDLISRMEKLKINSSDEIYADAAEPNRIEEISRAGFNIHPANKSVKDGIDYIKTMSAKIFSLEENINLNNEVNTYSWKRDKNGNIIDEPVKFNDHALDALRYALYTHTNKVTPSIRFV